jgi:hypothetical protein
MNKYVLRLVLGGLLVLSAVAAVGVLVEVAWARPLAPCTACDNTLGCAGSTCTCPPGGPIGGKCIPTL